MSYEYGIGSRGQTLRAPNGWEIQPEMSPMASEVIECHPDGQWSEPLNSIPCGLPLFARVNEDRSAVAYARRVQGIKASSVNKLTALGQITSAKAALDNCSYGVIDRKKLHAAREALNDLWSQQHDDTIHLISEDDT